MPVPFSAQTQAAILEFCKQATKSTGFRTTLLQRFEEIDKAVARERDLSYDTKATQAKERAGDPTKFRNIIAPVIEPQIENAVTYQASVFLTGSPLFEVSGDPESIDAAEQVTALWEENATVGGWTAEFLRYFRNAFKYNFAAAEVTWENRATYGVKLTPDTATGVTSASYNWSGNVLRCLDPYNTFCDSTVPPHEVPSRGEFAGWVDQVSRVGLNSKLRELDSANKLANDMRARASRTSTAGSVYTIPHVASEFFISRDVSNTIDWEAILTGDKSTGTNSLQITDSYEIITMYARICPADLGIKVDSPNTPQVWKFITVNNDVLIYAERMTNQHNLIPILITQAREHGLGYQTRSMAEALIPIQSCATSTINSAIQGMRRSVADRLVYNPRLIDQKHMMEDSATARIPLKPAATLQTNPAAAVYAFPYRDNSSEMLSHLPLFERLGNQITGQNPVRGGQFVKGNKTKQEFDTVMGNANGRDQVMAMHFETRFFTPLKQILLSNTIQFQKQKSVPTPDRKARITIDPQRIQSAYLTFKISDGLIPTEKLMDTESTAVAFQTLQAIPVLAAEYRIGELFAFLMKQRGAEIDDFRKSPQEIQYEQALAAWQQAATASAEKGLPFNSPQPRPQDYGITTSTAQSSPEPTGS